MYDRRFFRTRVGQAAAASMAAMIAFVVLSTQITVTAPVTHVTMAQTMEVA